MSSLSSVLGVRVSRKGEEPISDTIRPSRWVGLENFGQQLSFLLRKEVPVLHWHRSTCDF